MDYYLARQPIFGRDMDLYGYELLYRKSDRNYYEGTDDAQATAELIHNVVFSSNLHTITQGKKAFINFSEKLLLEKIPQLLSKDYLVVEILEDVTPSAAVIKEIRELKAKGYTIALDDFVFFESHKPLIELADIIKIDISVSTARQQIELIHEYGKKIKFLSERVENRQDYELGKKMGYTWFQGYFFSKPQMVKGRDVGVINTTILQLLDEINKKEPSLTMIADIIERDVTMVYKILKASNTIERGANYKITSVNQGLMRLGLTEIRRWVYVMALKEMQNKETDELVKNVLIRARFMDNLGSNLALANKRMELFLVGLFSEAEVIFHQSIIDIMREIPLVDDVQAALLGEQNNLNQVLQLVKAYEQGDWQALDKSVQQLDLDPKILLYLHLEALDWEKGLQEDA